MDTLKTFRSIHEMTKYLAETSCNKDDSVATYMTEWYGTNTYEEAEKRILQGDDDLAKHLRGYDKLKIDVPATGTRKKMITGVCGFMPHVPNALAGVPNNMIFCREQKVAKKVITVIYGCNTRQDVSTEEIAMVSARVVSCIMSLERKGYRVNLYASCVARMGRYNTAGFLTLLKSSGQQIDRLKMAFPLLSSSWNRRFGFRFREICNWSNMGTSLNGNELRSFLDRNNVKYDVALSFYDAAKIKTVDELEKMFVNNIKKFA